jgi:hypothetical protein
MLNMLLDQVKNAIFNSKQTPHQPDNDPDGLIEQITGLFGQQQAQQGTMQNPLPASQDPYGDPADQFPGNRAYADGGPQGQFPNLRPASQDPYGDPADGPQSQFPGIRPASEDPYGDPADLEPRR